MARKHDELAGLGRGMGLAACASMLSGSIKCHRCEHSFKAKVKQECSTCNVSHHQEADKHDATCWECLRRVAVFTTRSQDNWEAKP